MFLCVVQHSSSFIPRLGILNLASLRSFTNSLAFYFVVEICIISPPPAFQRMASLHGSSPGYDHWPLRCSTNYAQLCMSSLMS